MSLFIIKTVNHILIPIGIFLYLHKNQSIIEKTKAYILQTVAPIFNMKGYAGTSLSDLTKATGLTKGAIYGNFKNKEELAVQAFKLNLRRVMSALNSTLEKVEKADEKLLALTDYYRSYYDFTKGVGGCPILNVGSDTNHTNPVLFRLVKTASTKLEAGIEQIIRDGVEKEELKGGLDSEMEARNLYSMIEGSIFMASIHNNNDYLNDMMDLIDERIKEKLLI